MSKVSNSERLTSLIISWQRLDKTIDLPWSKAECDVSTVRGAFTVPFLVWTACSWSLGKANTAEGRHLATFISWQKLFSHCKTWSQWIFCYRICLLDKCKLMLSKGENGEIRREERGEMRRERLNLLKILQDRTSK